jgi:DNA-binding HxlR family transcriptional regulator
MSITEQDDRCPLTAALNAVGGKWSLTALYWLTMHPQRFAELQRLMLGVSHKVLTETLRALEQEDLIMRRIFPTTPPQVEYSISEHGRTVLGVIETMRIWGRAHLRWMDDRKAVVPAGQPIQQ